jgi:protein gp37
MLSDAYWKQPLAWNRAAALSNVRARVFCASMADVFERRPDLDTPRKRLWELIELTPFLDWLLLTKRPEHVSAMVPWRSHWPANVWLGATAENQRWAERRIPELLKHSAAVRFLSCEPLLGPINISKWITKRRRADCIDWVIAGGESGHHARPMNPEWTRSLRDQCQDHGIAFHFKQWGGWSPNTSGQQNAVRTASLAQSSGAPIHVTFVGKKAAGRVLDGREWNEVPAPATS